MTRRKLREIVFLILFGIDFYPPEELDEQVSLLISQIGDLSSEGSVRVDEIAPGDEAYIRERIRQIAEKREQIDQMVNEVSETWKTHRMGKAELSIIRNAVYEMRYDDAIDIPVAINEAVELARIYGSEQAPGFVNGVLARLVE